MKLIDGEKLIADLRRYKHETISVDGLEGLIDIMENVHESCKDVDTISRQAAIDAIMAIPEGNWGNIRYANEVKKVPSAQPEIIRCGQCKYAEVADPKDSQDGYTCQFHRGSIWFSGSYCSWAEKRGERDEKNRS